MMRVISSIPSAVVVPAKEAAYITKGKTETIRFPKVKNKDAKDWTSTDEEKAEVEKTGKNSGKVKGISYGSSVISCSYNGFIFKTTAYIEDPELVFEGQTIKNKAKLEMTVGQMKQFKVNKIYQTLNYKSSKPASAFIDENGFVYARKKGKATISTKINGTTYKFTVEVK